MKTHRARFHIFVWAIAFLIWTPFAVEAWGPRGEKQTDDELAKLQQTKLHLEIEDLKRKDKVSALRSNPSLYNAINLLNEPIITTLVTLLIGGILVSFLSTRRAKKNENLAQAIALMDGIARDINSILTYMFRHLRRDNYILRRAGRNTSQPELKQLDPQVAMELDRRIPTLFTKRLSVAIKSKAFLGSDDVSKGYDLLIKEMGKIARIMREITEPYDVSEVVKKVQNRRNALQKRWPRLTEVHSRKLKQPFKEINDWAEMVWSRAADLSTATLKELLR